MGSGWVVGGCGHRLDKPIHANPPPPFEHNRLFIFYFYVNTHNTTQHNTQRAAARVCMVFTEMALAYLPLLMAQVRPPPLAHTIVGRSVLCNLKCVCIYEYVLHLCTRACLYICVRVRVCMYVCMYVCIYAPLHLSWHWHTYTCIYASAPPVG